MMPRSKDYPALYLVGTPTDFLQSRKQAAQYYCSSTFTTATLGVTVQLSSL